MTLENISSRYAKTSEMNVAATQQPQKPQRLTSANSPTHIKSVGEFRKEYQDMYETMLKSLADYTNRESAKSADRIKKINREFRQK